MIYYKLDKELSGQKILEDLQKLISNYNSKDSVLVISVKKIIDYNGDSLLPKLEYRPT
jgi:hypothetical protein